MHQAVLIHPSELFTLSDMKIVVGMSQSELYCTSVAAWPQQNVQPEERDKGLKKSTWPLCVPDTWDIPEEYQYRTEPYRKGLTLTGEKGFQKNIQMQSVWVLQLWSVSFAKHHQGHGVHSKASSDGLGVPRENPRKGTGNMQTPHRKTCVGIKPMAFLLWGECTTVLPKQLFI